MEDGIWFRRRQKTVSIVFRAELTRMEEPGVSYAKNETPPWDADFGRLLVRRLNPASGTEGNYLKQRHTPPPT